MRFYAGLHIHSKYSLATSRDCNLENLAFWGLKKGLRVIGTGDFTHPAWIREIGKKPVLAECGIFKLRKEWLRWVDEKFPPGPSSAVRFILCAEISTVPRSSRISFSI